MRGENTKNRKSLSRTVKNNNGVLRNQEKWGGQEKKKKQSKTKTQTGDRRTVSSHPHLSSVSAPVGSNRGECSIPNTCFAIPTTTGFSKTSSLIALVSFFGPSASAFSTSMGKFRDNLKMKFDSQSQSRARASAKPLVDAKGHNRRNESSREDVRKDILYF